MTDYQGLIEGLKAEERDARQHAWRLRRDLRALEIEFAAYRAWAGREMARLRARIRQASSAGTGEGDA